MTAGHSWRLEGELRTTSKLARIAPLLCVLSVACVTPIESRDWIRVDTEHFEIVSGAPEDRTFEIARRLELLRAILSQFGVEMLLEPTVPALVYVFGDANAYARFRPQSGFSGFMMPRTNRFFLVIDASDEDAANEIALHEYVHFVLLNDLARGFPQWYDEGFADFLSTIAIEDEHAVIGRIPSSRMAWLLYGSPLSMRRVMTASDVYTWPESTLERFYAQAWATVHFFQLGGRAGLPDRHRQMVRYLSLLDAGTPAERAVREAFGTDFEGLEAEFLKYLAQRELHYVGLRLDRLGTTGEPTSTPLPEGERRRLLGDLAWALGEDWRDEAILWYGHAVESDPADARAHAALGVALLPTDPESSDWHVKHALAIGGDDAAVHRLCADALLERALGGEAEDWREILLEARRRYARSLELEPGDVPALAGSGRASLGLGEIERGVEALRTAHARLPSDRSLTLELARAEAELGRTENARELLLHLPPPSHGDPEARDDPERFDELREMSGIASPPPAAQRHLETRLDVDRPAEGTRVAGLSGWVEVVGRGGLWESKYHDLVIAIDESSSTLDPTGTDLDRDGKVGRLVRNARYTIDASSDPDDSIIRAELEAAEVLLKQLDERTTRVAVITFSRGARLLAPFGTPAEALVALSRYEVRVDNTGTSLASPLALASERFFENRDPSVRRQRSVFLLSDGQPTFPSPRHGKSDAIENAEQLGKVGVPIHAFALGEEALEDPEFYRSLAEVSHGEFVPVEDPAEIIAYMTSVRFTGLTDVRMESEPGGGPARSVRVFADGSFDGYVPLVPGRNTITVSADIEGSGTLRESRVVYLDVPAKPGPEDVAAAKEQERALDDRAVEFGLLEEIRRKRRTAQSRQLEVEVEEADRPTAP